MGLTRSKSDESPVEMVTKTWQYDCFVVLMENIIEILHCAECNMTFFGIEDMLLALSQR